MLPEGGSTAEAHRASKVGLRDFGHEHDGCVFGLSSNSVELAPVMPKTFLQNSMVAICNEADAEVGDAFGSCIVGRPDFSFNATVAEPAGNEDAIGLSQRRPCGLVFLCRPIFFEMTGFDPVDDEFSVDGHGGVLQTLNDGEVRVGKVVVLANHGDVDLFGERVQMEGHGLPIVQHSGG